MKRLLRIAITLFLIASLLGGCGYVLYDQLTGGHNPHVQKLLSLFQSRSPPQADAYFLATADASIHYVADLSTGVRLFAYHKDGSYIHASNQLLIRNLYPAHASLHDNHLVSPFGTRVDILPLDDGHYKIILRNVPADGCARIIGQPSANDFHEGFEVNGRRLPTIETRKLEARQHHTDYKPPLEFCPHDGTVDVAFIFH
jgi:hypothetical protein